MPSRRKVCDTLLRERGVGISIVGSAGLVALALLFFSCIEKPLAPVAPTWDVNVTIPLAERTYTLAEIVAKDPSLLQTGVGNQIIYATSLQAEPIYVQDRIGLSFPDTSVTLNLGPVAIAPFSWSVPLNIPLSLRGQTVPVPDTTVDFADVEYTPGSFQSVTFAQGSATVTVRNNLPVAIEIPGPVTITDNAGNLVGLFSFVPSTIPPFGSRSSSQNLAEKRLSSPLNVSGLSIHILGSSTPVTIPAAGDLISIQLQTRDLEARRAVLAQIPPQRLTDNNVRTIPLDDSTLVKELVIKSGSLNLFVSSAVDLDMGVIYRFKELYRWTGSQYVAFEDSVELQARASQSRVIDLAGLRIASTDGSLLSALEVISSVSLRTGSPGPVTVSEDDQIQFSLSKSTLVVADTVVALLKPTWLNIDECVRVDFGDLPTRFSGQVNIPSASMVLSVASTVGYPMDLSVKVGARSGDGNDSVFLAFPGSQRIDARGTSEIRFDPASVGRFWSSMSGKLPDSLRITGAVLLSPPDLYALKTPAVGSAGRASSLGGALGLEVPLTLGVINGTYKDTIDAVDKNDRGELDAVNYGKAYVEVTNGLPLDIELDMSLIDGTRKVLLPLPPSGEPVQVPAAPVDAGGNVTVPSRASVVIELAGQDVRQLKVADFLAASFDFQTTGGGNAVRFRTDDFVALKVWSQLSYKVNGK